MVQKLLAVDEMTFYKHIFITHPSPDKAVGAGRLSRALSTALFPPQDQPLSGLQHG